VRLVLKDRNVILLTGTPGVGKTSIARRLSQQLDMVHVDISEFAIEKGLVVERDENRQTFVIDEDKLREELLKLIEQVSKQGRELLLDGHFADIVPKKLLKCVIVLRLNPKELFDRLVKKRWVEKKIKENVEAELLDVCLIRAVEKYGEKIVKEVDVTGLNEDEASKLVLEALSGKNDKFKPGSVNWLKVIEEDEDFRKRILL